MAESTESAPSSADVHAPETSPEQTDEHPSPSWWSTLTSRLGGHRRAEEAPEAEESTASSKPASRTYSDDEIGRLVQSETDRREALRNKQARDAERRRLRDEDPWQYAEQDRQTEHAQTQETQIAELFQSIGQIHDSVTLVPLMEMLEPAEREKVLALPGAGTGTDGRKLLTVEALKTLEKRWKAEGAREAEARLRRNSTFRKQLMSEFGAASEPEVVPPSGAISNGAGASEINAWMRRQVGIHNSA